MCYKQNKKSEQIILLIMAERKHDFHHAYITSFNFFKD